MRSPLSKPRTATPSRGPGPRKVSALLRIRIMTIKIPATVFGCLLAVAVTAAEPVQLLNASYDVTREFYKDFNAAFIKAWAQKTGQALVINMSHGGSSKQARAVADGLAADVVTMNQANDIDLLHDHGGLVPADWQSRFPHNSAPFTSTMVFVVRAGNPKGIHDWQDLVRPGVSVIIPNPKTSGNGRYSYLAAWGSILKKGGNEKQARDFVTRLFRQVPVLDTGGRGATTTFAQRNIGDVLVTFENEVFLIQKELGADKFAVVYPALSILAEPPVAVVDKVVDQHGTRTVAQAYLEYLYSEEGQELVVQHHFRPRSLTVRANHAESFPKLELFSLEEVFGSWQQAQKIHFTDGGVFDQIYDR